MEIRIADGGRLAAGQPEGRDLHAQPRHQKGWNAPEKTAEAFYGDRLRSGDVGYLDEEGFLFVTDRKYNDPDRRRERGVQRVAALY